MKRYMNMALLYAVLAMVGGVFYREFTKINGFTAKTTLAVVHTHYFLLGMVFFLLLVLLEKSFSFTGPKTGRVLAVYHIGLNLTVVMFVVRRDSSGTRDCAFRRYGRGNFRYCRNRTHPAGDQYGTSVDADQAERCGKDELK